METRAELNARLMLAGMPKGTYAKLLGMTPQVVSRHGDSRKVPHVAESLVRAWELMTPAQREQWVGIFKAIAREDKPRWQTLKRAKARQVEDVLL